MSKVNPHRVIDSITLKIMRTLVDNPGRNYTRNKLAEASGIDPDSIYFRWDTLNNLDIVKKAQVESPHDYYTYNKNSRASVILEELLYDIIEVEENQ